MAEEYRIVSVLRGENETRALRFGGGSRQLLILPGLSLGSVLRSAPAVAAAYKCFTQSHTVTLLDRRNTLPAAYSVWDMAEDTAAAMDALRIENADVMGVSQGGMIALCLALARPEKIRRLALCSSAARLSAAAEGVLARWRALAAAEQVEELTADFTEKLFSPAFAAQYGALIQAQNRSLGKEDLARFMKLSQMDGGFDVTDRLPEIACKTLVLGATHDAVLGEGAGEETARLLPDCQSYFYPAPYGHGVYDEAPDYKKWILAFFT